MIHKSDKPPTDQIANPYRDAICNWTTGTQSPCILKLGHSGACCDDINGNSYTIKITYRYPKLTLTEAEYDKMVEDGKKLRKRYDLEDPYASSNDVEPNSIINRKD